MEMYDSRLIGTWRSDATKTAIEIAARRDITTAKKKKLRRFFGQLELRYTRTHCYSFLNGKVSVNRYRVVAKDSSSVAVIASLPIVGDRIFHIHFESGRRYWVLLGSGRMSEFFKRVSRKPSKKRKKQSKSRRV
jgi:hypothetical protein